MWPARIITFLLVGLWSSATAFGENGRSEVEVTMFAVPETVWQERFETQVKEQPSLWLQLNTDAAAGVLAMPVDFKFRLSGGEPVIQRKGAEEEFTESWRTWPGGKMPEEKTKRFIGTSVELAEQPTSEGRVLRVTMDLEHHIAPPVLQRFNYANAADGAERDRLSVAYPRFEKLEWHGRLNVWREWRLVANVLHLPVIDPKSRPATRYLVFIKRA